MPAMAAGLAALDGFNKDTLLGKQKCVKQPLDPVWQERIQERPVGVQTGDPIPQVVTKQRSAFRRDRCQRPTDFCFDVDPLGGHRLAVRPATNGLKSWTVRELDWLLV